MQFIFSRAFGMLTHLAQKMRGKFQFIVGHYISNKENPSA